MLIGPESKTSHLAAKWLPRLLWLAIWLLLALGSWTGGRQSWAEYHLRAARRECDERHFDAARAHLAACLGVRPRSYEVHFLAARAARRAGDYPAAERHIDQCQALVGVTTDVQLERALILAQQGEVDGVVARLRTLVEAGHADRLLILEAVAKGYMRRRRTEDALGCLNSWLDGAPDDPVALAMRARIHGEAKSYQMAIADYEHILQVDANDDAARFGLADALLAFKQPELAFTHFQILKDRNYSKADVLARLARCQQKFGEMGEARLLFDELLSAYPDHVPALTERAQIALADNRTDEAEAFLRRALQHDPAYREAHYRLYLCLKQAGKEEEAAKQNERRRQVEEDLTRFFELMNRDIPKRPHDAQLMYEAGMICLRNRELEGAVFWLQRALRHDPEHRPTHQALAEYYDGQGQKERAAEHRKRAAPKLSPEER